MKMRSWFLLNHNFGRRSVLTVFLSATVFAILSIILLHGTETTKRSLRSEIEDNFNHLHEIQHDNNEEEEGNDEIKDAEAKDETKEEEVKDEIKEEVKGKIKEEVKDEAKKKW